MTHAVPSTRPFHGNLLRNRFRASEIYAGWRRFAPYSLCLARASTEFWLSAARLLRESRWRPALLLRPMNGRINAEGGRMALQAKLIRRSSEAMASHSYRATGATDGVQRPRQLKDCDVLRIRIKCRTSQKAFHSRHAPVQSPVRCQILSVSRVAAATASANHPAPALLALTCIFSWASKLITLASHGAWQGWRLAAERRATPPSWRPDR